LGCLTLFSHSYPHPQSLQAAPDIAVKLAGLAAHVICGPWDADKHASRDYLAAAGLCATARGDNSALICEHHRQARSVVGVYSQPSEL